MAANLFGTGFLLILAVTVGAGLIAKRLVKKAQDFSNAGGKLSSPMVAGALVGGFVGGTSIVGTGEMAFRQGLTALWFTLGGGVSVICLGLFAARFRRLQVETLPAMIGHEYGERARLGASLFLCLGMFIQVIAQILAALPILDAFGEGALAWHALVPSLLIVSYILFGGFMGASMVGTLKTLLLLLMLLGAGGYLLDWTDGAMLGAWQAEGRLSLFAAGAAAGLAQGGAMFVGIFSTQAYLQPIFAGRSDQDARRGAWAAGLVIMVLGLLSAWIGLYMHQVNPQLPPRQAVPKFFLTMLPDVLAGAAFAVILLSVVMTGAALTLSIATILNQDVLQRLSSRVETDKAKLAASRLLIVGVVLIAYTLVCLSPDSYILEWAFLSMTLRGVTIFLPILCYLLAWGPLEPRWAERAIWGAPGISLVWVWLGQPLTGIDPFYPGAAWSLLTLLAAKAAMNRKPTTKHLR